MADEPDERFTPTTGLPIEQAPDYTGLPTQGVEDPAYGAAVRGEDLRPEDQALRMGEMNPDTGKVEPYERKDISWGEGIPEELRRVQDERLADIERQVQEARANLARTPDGVEGDPSGTGAQPMPTELPADFGAAMRDMLGVDPAATYVDDSQFLTATRIGLGKAIDDELHEPMVAVVLEADPPDGIGGPTIRMVRALNPFAALRVAQQMIDHALSLIAAPGETPSAPAAEPSEAAPDAAAALDTEE